MEPDFVDDAARVRELQDAVAAPLAATQRRLRDLINSQLSMPSQLLPSDMWRLPNADWSDAERLAAGVSSEPVVRAFQALRSHAVMPAWQFASGMDLMSEVAGFDEALAQAAKTFDAAAAKSLSRRSRWPSRGALSRSRRRPPR